MKHVVSYIRVSGKSQVDGDGPERQRDSISSFCATHVLHNRGEFFDAGVSGTVEGMDRPQFSELIASIECRRINGENIVGIVVERMDRLARDLMVQELMLAECRKRNIQVFSADRGDLSDVASDAGDPTRKLIRQVMGALAEWEKSQIVLKLRKGKDRKKAQGIHQDGPLPYGNLPGEKEIMIFVEASWNPSSTWDERAIMMNATGLKSRKTERWTATGLRSFVTRRLPHLFLDNDKHTLKGKPYGRTIQST